MCIIITIRVRTHFYLLRITNVSREKAGESTSAKDERIIMLHTYTIILLYSLQPVKTSFCNTIISQYEEHKISSYHIVLAQIYFILFRYLEIKYLFTEIPKCAVI